MIIEFNNWSNKSRVNYKDRVYVTVDGVDAGYFERANANTQNRDNRDVFTSTIKSELFETITETMKIDWIEFYGERETEMDDLDVFNMYQLAGQNKLDSIAKRSWTSKFAKEWMNGVDLG